MTDGDPTGFAWSDPRAEMIEGGEAVVIPLSPLDGERGALGYHEEDGGSTPGRLVLEPEQARELAVKLLTAAGPDPERTVHAWQAGQVVLTVEAPVACDAVARPWLFVRPENSEEFDRVLAAFGGILAFREPDPTNPALHAAFDLSDGVSLNVHLHLPPEMEGRIPKPAIPAMVDLKRQHAEQSAQVADEQQAADKLAGDHAKRTAIVDLLRGLRAADAGERSSAAKIAALLDPPLSEQEVETLIGPLVADGVLATFDGVNYVLGSRAGSQLEEMDPEETAAELGLGSDDERGE